MTVTVAAADGGRLDESAADNMAPGKRRHAAVTFPARVIDGSGPAIWRSFTERGANGRDGGGGGGWGAYAPAGPESEKEKEGVREGVRERDRQADSVYV